MSEIFQTETTPVEQPQNKFAIAIRYGLMAGFIAMFLTTINYLYFLKIHFMLFSATGILGIIISITLYFIAAKKQRHLLGGFISVKDAFQVIFIVILISLFISTVYGIIYTKFIDPDCLVRMKESMLHFFEGIKSMPQESIDEQMKRMDETIASSQTPAKLMFSFASAIILNSIFGFIVALIVKKERPAIPQ